MSQEPFVLDSWKSKCTGCVCKSYLIWELLVFLCKLQSWFMDIHGRCWASDLHVIIISTLFQHTFGTDTPTPLTAPTGHKGIPFIPGGDGLLCALSVAKSNFLRITYSTFQRSFNNQEGQQELRHQTFWPVETCHLRLVQPQDSGRSWRKAWGRQWHRPVNWCSCQWRDADEFWLKSCTT